MRGAGLAVLVVLLIGGACAPAPDSPWSSPQAIARALQFSAPAAARSRDGLVFVWTGFDSRNTHHDARRLDGNGLHPTIVLPLPPTYPFDQRLIAGADGTLHLFWLDAAPDGEDGNRLYTALLGPDLAVARGPVAVSDAPTYQYALTDDGAGGVWAAWTGGHPAEPALSLARIDADGRPGLSEPLASNSQHPALVRDGAGNLLVFHLSEGQLQRWTLANGAIRERAALTAHRALLPGDVIEEAWAAPCGRPICAGWNVVRSSGEAETWLAAGSAEAEFWAAPRRLTGWTWLTPARTAPAGDALIVAAAGAEGLHLLTIRSGEIAGDELAVPGVRASGQAGLQWLDGKWVLMWAVPGPTSAELWFSARAAEEQTRSR